MKVEIERVPGTIDIEYDHVCWECNNEPNNVRSGTCHTCGGVGYALTSAGEELALFITRHFHVVRKKRE